MTKVGVYTPVSSLKSVRWVDEQAMESLQLYESTIAITKSVRKVELTAVTCIGAYGKDKH